MWVWRWGVQTQGYAPCLPVFAERHTHTTLLKPRFPPCLAEKASFNQKSHLCPESMSETSSNQGFTQFGPKNCENDNFCQKTRLRRPATSCDVFCDACDVFCDALRRFLRRPATSCDVFRRLLAVSGVWNTVGGGCATKLVPFWPSRRFPVFGYDPE